MSLIGDAVGNVLAAEKISNARAEEAPTYPVAVSNSLRPASVAISLYLSGTLMPNFFSADATLFEISQYSGRKLEEFSYAESTLSWPPALEEVVLELDPEPPLTLAKIPLSLSIATN